MAGDKKAVLGRSCKYPVPFGIYLTSYQNEWHDPIWVLENSGRIWTWGGRRRILRNNMFDNIVTAELISLTQMMFFMTISLDKPRYKVASVSFCDGTMRHACTSHSESSNSQSQSFNKCLPSVFQALCQALGMLQRAKVDLDCPSWSQLSTGGGKY